MCLYLVLVKVLNVPFKDDMYQKKLIISFKKWTFSWLRLIGKNLIFQLFIYCYIVIEIKKNTSLSMLNLYIKKNQTLLHHMKRCHIEYFYWKIKQLNIWF